MEKEGVGAIWLTFHGTFERFCSLGSFGAQPRSFSPFGLIQESTSMMLSGSDFVGAMAT